MSPSNTPSVDSANVTPRRSAALSPSRADSHTPRDHKMASSGVQQLGKKSDALGLRGLHRPPRDSQTSNSSTESSNFPPTPLDEITLSLQRYASEQEAVEKKKRLSRGRTTSQDLDVSFDNEDDDALAPRLPQRRSLDRSPSSHQAEPQQRPVSGAEQENTESIIPFPKAAEKRKFLCQHIL